MFGIIGLAIYAAAGIFLFYFLWTVAKAMKRVAESLHDIAQAMKEKR